MSGEQLKRKRTAPKTLQCTVCQSGVEGKRAKYAEVLSLFEANQVDSEAQLEDFAGEQSFHDLVDIEGPICAKCDSYRQIHGIWPLKQEIEHDTGLQPHFAVKFQRGKFSFDACQSATTEPQCKALTAVDQWSVDELKRLTAALAYTPTFDVHSLARHCKTKTRQQVALMLDELQCLSDVVGEPKSYSVIEPQFQEKHQYHKLPLNDELMMAHAENMAEQSHELYRERMGNVKTMMEFDQTNATYKHCKAVRKGGMYRAMTDRELYENAELIAEDRYKFKHMKHNPLRQLICEDQLNVFTQGDVPRLLDLNFLTDMLKYLMTRHPYAHAMSLTIQLALHTMITEFLEPVIRYTLEYAQLEGQAHANDKQQHDYYRLLDDHVTLALDKEVKPCSVDAAVVRWQRERQMAGLPLMVFDRKLVYQRLLDDTEDNLLQADVEYEDDTSIAWLETFGRQNVQFRKMMQAELDSWSEFVGTPRKAVGEFFANSEDDQLAYEGNSSDDDYDLRSITSLIAQRDAFADIEVSSVSSVGTASLFDD